MAALIPTASRAALPSLAADWAATALSTPSSPPAAYLAFCARQPAECGVGAVEVAQARAKADRAAAAQLAEALAARFGGPAAPKAPTPAAQPAAAPIPLTPALWARLNRVNREVNRRVRPADDAALYGETDYWTLPLEAGRVGGDCDDYVLEKVHALARVGVPRRALSFAVVRTREGVGHAVLLVNTTDGELVLDNRTPAITTWRGAGYRLTLRQVPGRPLDWRAPTAAGL